MEVYIHNGAGHYIGSCVIVITDTPESAAAIIRKQLDNSGLKEEPLNITALPIEKDKVYHSDNGDY